MPTIPDQTSTVYYSDPVTGRWVREPLQYRPRITDDALHFFGVVAIACSLLLVAVVLGA